MYKIISTFVKNLSNWDNRLSTFAKNLLKENNIPKQLKMLEQLSLKELEYLEDELIDNTLYMLKRHNDYHLNGYQTRKLVREEISRRSKRSEC